MNWQRKDLLGIQELSAEEIVFLLDAAKGVFQPDFKIVDSEIKAGRPLAVRILWSDGGGHAVVVYGVTDDRKVMIADPESANDEVIVPFDDFVYKDIGSWSASLFTRS